MAHRRARLTPFGRYLLIMRILQDGWSVSAAAESLGVSRATAHKWLRRFREEGLEGLEERSSAPHRRPSALSKREVDRICRARRRLKVGPHRLGPALGHPRSTVYAVLRRRGLSRLSHLDRPTALPIRYEREHPGELLHVDVKKLGRFWEVGKRILKDGINRSRHAGWSYLHVAIDDHTRLAYAELLKDERGPSCAAFLRRAHAWYAERGITLERVLSDNAKAYHGRHWQATCAELGISRRYTRPYSPWTNGKAEALIKTMLREWAYRFAYPTSSHRARALSGYLRWYNNHRPHGSLAARPPISRVSNVCDYSS